MNAQFPVLNCHPKERGYEMFVAFIGINCRDYLGNKELSRIVTASIRTARSRISAAPSDEN